MRRALALARRGEGLTRPNPAVGAVVVRKGRLVGSGFHRKAGGPHAEVVALQQAGVRARGATLYVTLEPCSTWGRTPPCTEAIMAAGIQRVVVATTDPNPKHAGRGLDVLRARGVVVVSGTCENEARELLAPFAKWITTGRPWVTLKLGMTLDGRLADARGRSQWITGPVSRQKVHDLRRRVDGILVGRNTAIADDPTLLPVPARGRCPFRIVLDRQGRIPLHHRIFSDGQAKQTIVATSKQSPRGYREKLAARGVDVLVLPVGTDGLRLPGLLKALGGKGLLHMACEGGGRLAGSLLKADLVDELWLFVAPRLLGEQGVPAVGGVHWTLDHAPRLVIREVMRCGDDVWIKAGRRKD